MQQNRIREGKTGETGKKTGKPPAPSVLLDGRGEECYIVPIQRRRGDAADVSF